MVENAAMKKTVSSCKQNTMKAERRVKRQWYYIYIDIKTFTNKTRKSTNWTCWLPQANFKRNHILHGYLKQYNFPSKIKNIEIDSITAEDWNKNKNNYGAATNKRWWGGEFNRTF